MRELDRKDGCKVSSTCASLVINERGSKLRPSVLPSSSVANGLESIVSQASLVAPRGGGGAPGLESIASQASLVAPRGGGGTPGLESIVSQASLVAPRGGGGAPGLESIVSQASLVAPRGGGGAPGLESIVSQASLVAPRGGGGAPGLESIVSQASLVAPRGGGAPGFYCMRMQVWKTVGYLHRLTSVSQLISLVPADFSPPYLAVAPVPNLMRKHKMASNSSWRSYTYFHVHSKILYQSNEECFIPSISSVQDIPVGLAFLYICESSEFNNFVCCFLCH